MAVSMQKAHGTPVWSEYPPLRPPAETEQVRPDPQGGQDISGAAAARAQMDTWLALGRLGQAMEEYEWSVADYASWVQDSDNRPFNPRSPDAYTFENIARLRGDMLQQLAEAETLLERAEEQCHGNLDLPPEIQDLCSARLKQAADDIQDGKIDQYMRLFIAAGESLNGPDREGQTMEACRIMESYYLQAMSLTRRYERDCGDGLLGPECKDTTTGRDDSYDTEEAGPVLGQCQLRLHPEYLPCKNGVMLNKRQGASEGIPGIGNVLSPRHPFRF
ncbi:MAG: hypothetical protein M3O22_01075 [Pseudomonadota bacterium]|nr:hypothetical protein [Pseudomonadota bacterium]